MYFIEKLILLQVYIKCIYKWLIKNYNVKTKIYMMDIYI